MDVVRVFLADTDPLTSWTDPRLSGDLPLVVSFKGRPLDIRSGADDLMFTEWFAQAPRDRDIYWSFYHEPEDNIADGDFTAADYRAAFQRLAELAAKAGNPRLHATLILSGWTLDQRSKRTWTDYYPGSEAIDVVAWDIYNLESKKFI
jgi:hypothetical protein